MGKAAQSMAKAYAYYKNNMYEKKLGMKDMFFRTQEVYNPIPSTVGKMQEFSLKGFKVEVPEGLKGIYEENNDLNDYHNTYKALVKRVVLYEETFIEVIPTEEGEYINIVDKNMVSDLSKKNGKITYARIEGKTEGGKSLTKEYFNGIFDIEGQKVFKRGFIVKGDDGVGEFIPTEDMRLIHIPKSYVISGAFNKIDRINEFKYFIYAMGRANGDPKLLGKALSELTDAVKKELEVLKQKYNLSEKMIFSQEEKADLKYIELQGVIIPHFQKEIETLKNELLEDYPEFSLTKAMGGSNISEETMKAKILEVGVKIEEIRKAVGDAFDKALKIIFRSDKAAISYDPLERKDEDKEVDKYMGLYQQGIISLFTFQSKLVELGIIDSVEEEQGRISKEAGDPYSGLGEE